MTGEFMLFQGSEITAELAVTLEKSCPVLSYPFRMKGKGTSPTSCKLARAAEMDFCSWGDSWSMMINQVDPAARDWIQAQHTALGHPGTLCFVSEEVIPAGWVAHHNRGAFCLLSIFQVSHYCGGSPIFPISEGVLAPKEVLKCKCTYTWHCT